MNITFFTGNFIMDTSMFLFFGVFAFIVIIFITGLLAKKKTYEPFSPAVSVLVPAYNEEKNIVNCLKAIIANKYENYEIIVIDDGSTDKTVKKVQKLQEKYKQIKIVKGNHKGKSAALNKGLQVSKYNIIVSIDADTLVDKKFMWEIVKPFNDPMVGATNGMCMAHKPKSIVSWFQSVEYIYNNFIRTGFSSAFGNGIWFFGAAAAYKKSVLEKVQGFSSQTMTEDMDISLEIFEAGYKVITVEDAIYFTIAPPTLKELFIQRMRWFYGGIQNMIKHKKAFSKKSFAIKFLVTNQVFWSVYSLLIIPIVIYQVNYWLPTTPLDIAYYIFRWFSLLGPVVVLQKIPEWGLNFVNIFGVTAGILTTILIAWSFVKFNKKISFKDIIVIFFYFPYTLILNASFLVAAIQFPFKKKKGFIK